MILWTKVSVCFAGWALGADLGDEKGLEPRMSFKSLIEREEDSPMIELKKPQKPQKLHHIYYLPLPRAYCFLLQSLRGLHCRLWPDGIKAVRINHLGPNQIVTLRLLSVAGNLLRGQNGKRKVRKKDSLRSSTNFGGTVFGEAFLKNSRGDHPLHIPGASIRLPRVNAVAISTMYWARIRVGQCRLFHLQKKKFNLLLLFPTRFLFMIPLLCM